MTRKYNLFSSNNCTNRGTLTFWRRKFTLWRTTNKYCSKLSRSINEEPSTSSLRSTVKRSYLRRNHQTRLRRKPIKGIPISWTISSSQVTTLNGCLCKILQIVRLWPRTLSFLINTLIPLQLRTMASKLQQGRWSCHQGLHLSRVRTARTATPLCILPKKRVTSSILRWLTGMSSKIISRVVQIFSKEERE